MLIGPLVTLCINLAKIDDNAVEYMPPFEIFLAGTIIAVFAIIPIVFVMKDANRLRQAKLDEALQEKEDAETETADDGLTMVCTCGEEGCSCPFDCTSSTEENMNTIECEETVENAETAVENDKFEE
jgi:hypothetical protein